MIMQFNDLSQQYARLKDKIDESILKVLAGGRYIMGEEVKELEENLAQYVGVKHAITCSSGTDALLMPLMAWGITKGDAVFTTPFTFIATAEVVSLLGATPVFVDIDPDTYNIDPMLLEKAIVDTIQKGNLKPRAVIPVDLFGLPADYDKINKIASKYNLRVLEDAAQGFGGIYKGKKACSLSEAAATSFFPAKPLGCYGDGGAVFTNDDEMAAKLKSIRVHGQGKDKYDNVRTGINGRLDTLQAAILLHKLSIFNDEFEARNRAAELYTQRLKDVLVTPFVPEGLLSCWAQYSVKARDTKEREVLQQHLKNCGIPTAVYYSKPLHLQTAYKELGYVEGDLPVSEETSLSIFSLPMHPYLKAEEIEEISSAIKDIL